MLHHNFSKIKIPDDPVDYGRRWLAWWKALQPAWRKSKDPRELFNKIDRIPHKADWSKLAVAGQNGIGLALVGLAI